MEKPLFSEDEVREGILWVWRIISPDSEKLLSEVASAPSPTVAQLKMAGSFLLLARDINKL